MLDKIIPFFIAAGIGLAIGIERERRYANTRKPMGVRTFVLLALLGALAGFVSDPLMAVTITVLASLLIVAGYIQSVRTDSQNGDLGLTTEFAAGVTFVIGSLTHTEPFVSAILGLLTLVVLLSRERLHHFTLKQIRTDEIQAAVMLFILGVGVLPLLPDEPIDPFGLLNLNRFVMLWLLVGSVQFAGYLATRFFGPLIGFPLTGLVSGFVSSTAVFLVMPDRVKENPKIAHAAAAASLFAAASTFIFLFFVVAVISLPLALKILPPILAAIVIGSAVGAFVAGRETNGQVFPEPKNPLSLLGALKLAAILSGFMIAIGLLQNLIGDRGAQVASFLVGLGELHGVAIASASLFANDKIPFAAAETNILLAALGSLVSKLVISLLLRRARYSVWVTSTVVLMMAGFIAAWLLVQI